MSYDRVRDFIVRHHPRLTCVLVVRGRAKCMDVNSRKVNYFIKCHAAQLVGVYDGRCDEQGLQDDLKLVGVKT